MAETIEYYENIIAGIYEKIGNHEPLRPREKIDFYVANQQICLIKCNLETNMNLRNQYLRLADENSGKAIRLEKRFGIRG